MDGRGSGKFDKKNDLLRDTLLSFSEGSSGAEVECGFGSCGLAEMHAMIARLNLFGLRKKAKDPFVIIKKCLFPNKNLATSIHTEA